MVSDCHPENLFYDFMYGVVQETLLPLGRQFFGLGDKANSVSMVQGHAQTLWWPNEDFGARSGIRHG